MGISVQVSVKSGERKQGMCFSSSVDHNLPFDPLNYRWFAKENLELLTFVICLKSITWWHTPHSTELLILSYFR